MCLKPDNCSAIKVPSLGLSKLLRLGEHFREPVSFKEVDILLDSLVTPKSREKNCAFRKVLHHGIDSFPERNTGRASNGFRSILRQAFAKPVANVSRNLRKFAKC